ncbi:hypothetical protein MJG53_005739 [Ovis ammon polii x Ovis aries]|uniref:Uncharacterized protein n=1 Tax=Ovis ammon polii x Ovis aries TaxID=2918886 RepID=A0ACB9V7R7_9CETA|nr:hypothetical protein MJG53_005739 [Ovis ammon polii x Ovis aries]
MTQSSRLPSSVVRSEQDLAQNDFYLSSVVLELEYMPTVIFERIYQHIFRSDYIKRLPDSGLSVILVFILECSLIDLYEFACKGKSTSFIMEETNDSMENSPQGPGRNNAVKCGWLRKQGGFVKTWHTRWFVLKGDQLYYFKDEDETKPLVAPCFLNIAQSGQVWELGKSLN